MQTIESNFFPKRKFEWSDIHIIAHLDIYVTSYKLISSNRHREGGKVTSSHQKYSSGTGFTAGLA